MSAVRLGMIIPSSNTVVEQETTTLLRPLPDASLHFARFRLTAVSVPDPAAAYYHSGLIASAGASLADARCNVITWNGSAGGLVGFDLDRKLCRDIEADTSIPATTTSLSVLDAFRLAGVRRFGMVTLNPPDMNERIVCNFAAEGYECVGSTHRTDVADNFAMASVSGADIAAMARTMPRSGADALLVFGTNTRGARIAAALEAELEMPVFDSVAVGLWGAMRRASIDPMPLRDSGSLFMLVA